MYSKTRSENNHNDGHSDVDVTPLLDVVFIMLIFFVVTASFVKEQGLGLNSSLDQAKTPPTSAPIVLEINADDEFLIQDQRVSASLIKPVVLRLKAENPESNVIVRVHPRATTRSMVAAIDRLKSANVVSPPISVSHT